MARFLLLFALAGCSADDYVELYRSEPRAPSLPEQSIANLEHMGATRVDQGVNFSLYSERATRVELLLFDDPESDQPTRQFEMTRFGDVYNVYVEGVGVGQHYGYVAWGPNWPRVDEWFPGSIHGFIADVDAAGNRFNPNKLLMDPYARALHRDHDWSKGSVASGPARTELTYAAAAKAVIVESQYEWSANEATWRQRRRDATASGHAYNDLVIYEVHPKGFTASPASAVAHPGTYRGFGEMAPYLADLGINAVELMPVHEKPLDGGYWGYQSLNFFAAELSYAFERDGAEVIDEFKWMVDQLHQHDIEVILDVVYNHTGEGGFWREKIEQDDITLDGRPDLVNFDPKEVAGLYSYRGIDNAAYYALGADNQTYWNDTGVGNQTRTNHRPTRRMIRDSLRYWVEEMHVDGFRFDLAPILGVADRDYSTWAPDSSVLQDIVDDPVLHDHNTRIISEPWSIGGFFLGGFPASGVEPGYAWYDWNANFRDFWRSYINDDAWLNKSREGPIDLGGALTGSFDLFNWNGRRPYHSVNFITVHDGFTLYDLFTYDTKRNGCSPLNPSCCDEPNSPFCDRDSGEDNNRSRDWNDPSNASDPDLTKRQMIRNALVGIMISHGTPMLLGGDELMRTQLGNNNAYSTRADNEANWFDWGAWQPDAPRNRMRDFVKQLIALRRERAYAFAPATYGSVAPFAWKSALNTEPANWSSRHMMVHYHDQSVGPELLILINMELGPVDFTLPTGRNWVRLLDTQSWFDSQQFLAQSSADPRATSNIFLARPDPIATATYQSPSRTLVILEAR